MRSALDIAKYIISSMRVDNLRLQKLLYYTQAVSLYQTGKPAFDDEIEAWDYGPVVPNVYREYRECGFDEISDGGLPDHPLPEDTIECVDLVLGYYGEMSGNALIRQTHSELPWKEAYKKGRNTPITTKAIEDYYKDKYVIE